MGGKKQGGGPAAGVQAGPRGPAVAGPSGLAGPRILERVVGPMNRQAMANQNSFKDTAAPIVGVIAGIVADYFAPGAGFFASKAADRTVREQVNVINGRPFFEGVNNEFTWSDAVGVIGSGVGSAASAGVNAAGAAGGAGARMAAQAGVNAAGVGARIGAGYLDRRGARRPSQPTAISGAIQRRPYIYGR